MCLDYIKLNCYFDGMLNEADKGLVEEHLLSCAKCRLSMNNLIVLNKTILSLNVPSINEGFIDKLIYKIDELSHPSCDELNDYCDNTLSGIEYNKVNIHIEDCEKCRISVNQIQNSSKNYFEQFDFKASGSFIDGIFDKIDLLEEEKIVKHLSNIEISSYIDNYLSEEANKDIESHLKECEKCEQKVALFGLTRETVLNLNKPIIHLNFSRKVLEEIEPKKENIISFSGFMRKFIPAVSMVAGLLIVGTFITLNKTIIDEKPVSTQVVNITVRSEDLLFSPQSQTYKTDSINILAENPQDDLIEDIGL